jgi:hypothetical protein
MKRFLLVGLSLAAALSFAAPTRASDGQAIGPRLERAIAERAPWLHPHDVSKAEQALAALPLRFEPNRGQADASASFVGHADGTLVFVRDRDLTIAVPKPDTDGGRLVRLRWLGAAAKPAFRGEGEQAARSHYFAGRDADAWLRDVPGYDKVRAAAVYPGIDLVLYGRDGSLEFDFAVAAGADPGAIRFGVEGADRVALDGDALAVAIGDTTLRLAAPIAYQEIGGARRTVAARYALAVDGQVRVALGAYDRRVPLVIDPVLGYSTYLGGTGFDIVHTAAVDAQGQLVIAGRTSSTDFPLASPLFSTKTSGYTAFVAKLTAGGNQLLWSTFLGGARTLSGFDQMGVSLDHAGNVVVVGETNDTHFPIQNAYQSTLGGDHDAFVTKLTPKGDGLVFSTYLGGSDEDYGRGVAFDAEGTISVVGITFSTDFPTHNPIQPSRNGGSDAFVARFYGDGTPIFATYLGGSALEWGYEVAASTLGETVVVGYTESSDFPTTSGAYQEDFGGGSDAFVTRFTADGQSRVYSTYVGGTDFEEALGVALDLDGNAYVVGWTKSTDFPTVNAFQSTPQGGDYDGFALKLDTTGANLLYSTRLGGSGVDFAYTVTVDYDRYATISGVTTSTNFPTVQPVQATAGGMEDGFVARLSPTGNGLSFSTYLGGSLQEDPFGMSMGIAVDQNGQIYLAHTTASTNYPIATTVPILQGTNKGGLDGAITKISTGTEALLRLRADVSGTIGRFRIANGLASNKAIEFRFWLESAALPTGLAGILTLTTPLTLPANLAPFEVSFTLPAAVTFPGSRLGLRLQDPVTGDVVTESICQTLPCN